VRAISFNSHAVHVTITPTFAGCPAYETMSEEIIERLQAAGVDAVEVHVRHDPPWTSEWVTDAARAKLKAAGLAPPPRHNGDLIQVLADPVPCPRCESTNTSLRNSFGTTPCRMMYTCNDCLEPFELFKPL
jgi:ring-1,2-phenylacetyl-CoA epoxidase subunit PaaD